MGWGGREAGLLTSLLMPELWLSCKQLGVWRFGPGPPQSECRPHKAKAPSRETVPYFRCQPPRNGVPSTHSFCQTWLLVVAKLLNSALDHINMGSGTVSLQLIFNPPPRAAQTPQPHDALEQAVRKGFSEDISGFEPGGKNCSLELQPTSPYISLARAGSHAQAYTNHQCDLEGSRRSGCCHPGQPQQMPPSPQQLLE